MKKEPPIYLLAIMIFFIIFPNQRVFSQKLVAGVGLENGKRGYIDTLGNVVIPFDFEVAGDFHYGRAHVRQKGLRGFINEKGELTIPCIYDMVWDFHLNNGYALVCKDGKYGYINREGKQVVPCDYYSVGSLSKEGIVKVRVDGVWQYIDTSGRIIYKPSDQHALLVDEKDYTEIKTKGVLIEADGDFYEGMAVVKRRGPSIFDTYYGYINDMGEQVVPFEYEHAERFFDGLAHVGKGRYYGFINTKGVAVIPLRYEAIYGFHEELAAAKHNGKWGFIDKKGNVVIPFKYKYALGFSENVAAVHNGEAWGFIDKSGKESVPFIFDGVPDGGGIYDKVGGFQEGLAIVIKGGYGVIDKDGNEVLPCVYDYVTSGGQKFFRIVKDHKYGFANMRGELITQCKYDFIGEFHNGFACVSIKTGEEEKWGYINTKGEEIIPCQYHVAGDFMYTNEK